MYRFQVEGSPILGASRFVEDEVGFVNSFPDRGVGNPQYELTEADYYAIRKAYFDSKKWNSGLPMIKTLRELGVGEPWEYEVTVKRMILDGLRKVSEERSK